jgi:hypothetical protein
MVLKFSNLRREWLFSVFADFKLLELFFSLVVNTNEEHFDIIPNMLQT